MANPMRSRFAQITFAGVTALRWKRITHRRKEDHAARVIQGLLKIIRAKRTLQELKEEKRQHAAATKIQTIWRGYVARLRLALMKYLTPYAVVIQVRVEVLVQAHHKGLTLGAS